MNTVTKVVAIALATGALAVGATGNAFAHYSGWHSGYGYHFGHWYPHFYSGVSIDYSPCYWLSKPEGPVRVCPGPY